MLDRTRHAWLLLNADGVLLALLAVTSGVRALLSPGGDDIVAHLGYVPATFYLRTVALTLAGVLMVAGFYCNRIGLELGGRLLLCLTVALAAWREAAVFGWSSSEATGQYLALVIVTAFCAARAVALLSRHMTVIAIGGDSDG